MSGVIATLKAMDRFASLPSLPTSRKRSRSLSLPKGLQPKRPRIENWVEDTITSQSSSGPDSGLRARSDSELDLSIALDRQERTTCSERPRLIKGVLGPTLSDLSSESSPDSSDTDMDESIVSDKNVVKTTDPRYKECLRKRNISMAPAKVPNPRNWDTITRTMNKERDSPGPDDDKATRFCARVRKASNEPGAVQALLPLLLPIIDKFWDDPEDTTQVNQGWYKLLLLSPELNPRIAPPMPDQAFGFSELMFDFPQAEKDRGYFMCPARDLIWPYFTIEAKGWQGSLEVAELQNAHNGAIMLNNMLTLKTALNKEHEFYDRVQAVTMTLTTTAIGFAGHFMTQTSTGPKYYYRDLGLAKLTRDPDGFKESYARGMNLVEYMRKTTEAWVRNDLKELEQNLVQQSMVDEATVDSLAIRPTARAQKRGSGSGRGRGGSRRGVSAAESKSRASRSRVSKTRAPKKK